MTHSAPEFGSCTTVELTEPYTSDRLRQYADASGDMNLMHLDDEFARASGQQGAIVHGMFTLGSVVETVLARFGGDAWADRIDVRFGRVFAAGGHLTVDFEVLAVDGGTAQVRLVGRGQEGSPFVEGTMEVRCPPQR